MGFRKLIDIMKKYDIALFDLDGTLSESGEGILECVRKIFERTNRPLPSEEIIKSFIGPPIYDSLKRCGFSHEESEEGVKIYKEEFLKSGIYKNKVYDGMNELLSSLKENGVLLGVATTKYQPFAEKIINMLKLDRFFDFVGGATAGKERHTKELVIRYSLENLGANADSHIIMVGDTKFDAEGAANVGCDFIGVLYGYGTKQEMENFYKNAIFVNTPSEIKNIILD